METVVHCIALIGQIEIEKGCWNNLIEVFSSLVSNANTDVKLATLVSMTEIASRRVHYIQNRMFNDVNFLFCQFWNLFQSQLMIS